MNSLDNIMRFTQMRTQARLMLGRIKVVDRSFNRVVVEDKNGYLKENHEGYVNKIDEWLRELGDLTMKQGDSEELDSTKDFLYSCLFL